MMKKHIAHIAIDQFQDVQSFKIMKDYFLIL